MYNADIDERLLIFDYIIFISLILDFYNLMNYNTTVFMGMKFSHGFAKTAF